ncbi:MAG: hypothetical protein ABR573_05985 [Candidatus Dormibacteria bacterium]
MNLQVGRILSRSFAIAWSHRWLWLLGVFGGAGIGARFNVPFPSSRRGSSGGGQVATFISEHAALVLMAVLVVLVLFVVAGVIACIAVPASIWAGLQLDAGHEVGLRQAWGEGTRRGWRYFRLGLIKLGLGVAVGVPVALVALAGVAFYAAVGSAVIPLLVIGALVLVLALIAAFVTLGLGLAWSDRTLVILGVSAWDSVRASWWLFRHNKMDTFVFGFVMGVVQFGLTVGVGLLAAVVATPGIVMLVVYFAWQGDFILVVAGAAWVILLGGGALLLGGGFAGALSQVAYAIAARDLCLRWRLDVLAEVIGWDPRAAADMAPAT